MHRGRRPRQPQALKSSSQAHLALLERHGHPNTYDNPDPNAEWPSATLYDLGLESAATCILHPCCLGGARQLTSLVYHMGLTRPLCEASEPPQPNRHFQSP